jgi:hypothetical protein
MGTRLASQRRGSGRMRLPAAAVVPDELGRSAGSALAVWDRSGMARRIRDHHCHTVGVVSPAKNSRSVSAHTAPGALPQTRVPAQKRNGVRRVLPVRGSVRRKVEGRVQVTGARGCQSGSVPVVSAPAMIGPTVGGE